MVRFKPSQCGWAQTKKLVEAGEYWVNSTRPADDKSDLEGDLESFGFSAEQKETILSKGNPEDEDFIILPENWPALEIFLVCQTQWRYSSVGAIGLDYSAVLKVIETYYKKRKRKKSMFNNVQAIESGALAAIRALKKD